MNILLTGHEGYVGRGLSAYFARRHRVVGWGRREDLLALTPAVLSRERIDAVVNCAVVMDRESTAYDPDSPTDRVNVQGCRRLAAVLKGSTVPWFQISTREVFGPVFGPDDVVQEEHACRPKFLVAESQPFAPRTVYAKSKLMAEFISESHPASNVIRLSTCYTDLDHPRGNWMVQMLRDALQGRPVRLTRDGKQFRDPLHADDLGRLIESMLEKGIRGEKLNAGGGHENILSLREFLRLAAPGCRTEQAPGGDFGFAFDNRRAREVAGWVPEVLIRERIPTILEHLRRGLARDAG